MSVFSCLLIGNEPLTVACGKRLLAAGHRIAAVATRDHAVRAWAETEGLAVFEGAGALTGAAEVDWLFSIANLEMLPAVVLARARKGAVNFHDGPLPRYAGLNAPVWALLAGEATHGITWHLMEEGADRGDLLVQRSVAVAEDDTAFTLNAKCFAAGVESFDAVLDEIARGLPGRTLQDLSARSYFGRAHIPEGGGHLDLSAPRAEAMRLIRALDHGGHDNPVASAWLRTPRGPLRVTGAEASEGQGAPGVVLSVAADTVTVMAGDGALHLTGLSDGMGAEVVAVDWLDPGDILSGPEAEYAPALSTLSREEKYWNARFRDYFPVEIAGQGPGGGLQEAALTLTAPPTLPEAAAALGAVMAGEAVPLDLACGIAGDNGLAAPWVPLRFDAGQPWGAALAALIAEWEGLETHGPFAWDLPARRASIAARRLPMAGISETGPLPGVALTLVLKDTPRLLADGAVLTRAETERLARRLETLLDALPGLDPDIPLAGLPRLPEAERNLVITKFNDTETALADPACIHQAFEAQVQATPDAPALAFEDRELSYGELNRAANRLAHVLIGMGVTPGAVVGLHMSRRAELVVAALAILKAGAAYLPLDPDYPADRLAFYAQDSGAQVIVSEAALAGTLSPEGVTRIEVDRDPRIAQAPDHDPGVAVTGDDLAYLIYTSGSTGTPKGVMVEHGNVQNFFAGMDGRIDHGAGAVWLAVTSLSFDISVLELFWTLARGFKVVLLGDEKFVSGGIEGGALAGGMDFSLYYWGNDDGVGRDKYALLMEGARFADANGFQAVWTPERHFHAFGGLYPNPSVTGAAVAAITTNIGVRAGSCVAPLHHPARIAEEWAVIDNLTNGRAGLGFASGWQPDDFVLRPENSPPENKPAMLRAIDEVRRLWRGEALMMTRGDGTEVERLTQPRPVSKELPVWVTTAGNPETWVQAGEIGAHVLTHLLGQSIAEVGEKIALYHDALRKAGHDPADFTVTLMLHTFLAEDRETARSIARGPMKAYLKAAADLIKQYAWAFPAFKKPEGAESHRDLSLTGLSEEELDDILEFAFLRYFETSGLFGTVEDALKRVAEVKAIGVTEVACLVDYGIDRQTILDGLVPLAEVRARANPGEGSRDFSMAAQIARHGVTHLQCTPYMARMLLENDEARAALSRLSHLMIGGEAMAGALVADLQQATEARIENMYGPTETTIWSSTGPGQTEPAVVPVGTPIANTQIYVLNEAMTPVGVGQVGQLWIGGAGVARGYWQRPELTAEKFAENPFHGGRMFDTGDLARWREDGTLDFLGRADSQIKIRGYRIEIGEIEAAMQAVDGVSQAVAVLRRDASGTGQIQGYVTGIADESALRAALLERLPAFMVPARITRLDAFPLTPNRKIDRKALPDPDARPAPAPAPERPASAGTNGAQAEVPLEALAGLWQQVLNLPRVQASDNFFDLGGHSLLAIELHRLIKSELGITTVSIADIFRAPTLGGLADLLNATPQVPSVVSAPVVRSFTPTLIPERDTPEPETELAARRRALRGRRRPNGEGG